MKKKTVKNLIWIFLALISLGFVIYRNGVFSDLSANQQLTTWYAVAMAIVWSIIRLKVKRSSITYLLGIALYLSIAALMLLTGYLFSPTQFVATVALFFYLSKVFQLTFNK